MDAYLRTNEPARSQFRSPRRKRCTGLVVIHTAESILDSIGPDTGAENVARFIRDRSTAGSYHDLVDSDSNIQLVRYEDEAFQDGTGSNPFGLAISFALRAADWSSLSLTKRTAFLEQGALAFARQQEWLATHDCPTTPLRRITKAQSDAGWAGFISHGDRDPGRRSDPGADFPWAEWFAACYRAINGNIPAPHKEIDMIIVDDPSLAETEKNRQWLCDIDTKSRINDWDEVLGLRAAGVPHLEEKPETVGQRAAILARRKEVSA